MNHPNIIWLEQDSAAWMRTLAELFEEAGIHGARKGQHQAYEENKHRPSPVRQPRLEEIQATLLIVYTILHSLLYWLWKRKPCFSIEVNLEVGQMMNRDPFGPQFGTKQWALHNRTHTIRPSLLQRSLKSQEAPWERPKIWPRPTLQL